MTWQTNSRWLRSECLSHLRPTLRSERVVLDFSASLSDVAPVSPILFAVNYHENEINKCPMYYDKPSILSSVSVVFAFNDSLNDVAPAFPILLSIIHKEKEWQMNDTHVHSIVLTTKIKCNKRWICHQWFTECWSSHVSNLVNYWFGATENNNRLVSFPPYSPPRVSLNSAEFSFSPSLNNAAPMSPILFPVIVEWWKHFMF